MKTDYGKIIFAGYQSQKIEFVNVYNDNNLTSPDKRADLEAIIQAAASAESGLAPGAFFELLIVGHADRDDTPGRTPEQRRALELENSSLRADSAEAYVLNQIFAALQNDGLVPPVDAESFGAVVFRKIACGSADLAFTTPQSEGERATNRRVEIYGMAFTP